MSDGISFKLNGLDELRATLNSVSEDTQHKGGRYALRKAAQVIQAKAKQNAGRVNDPATPEEIAKNITIRWSGRRFKRTGDLMFRVGVLGGAKGHAAASGEVKGRGKGNPGGDTYYWRFLEFGTSKIAAQPFLRDAIASKQSEAISEFVNQYNIAIDRAIKRAAKNGGLA